MGFGWCALSEGCSQHTTSSVVLMPTVWCWRPAWCFPTGHRNSLRYILHRNPPQSLCTLQPLNDWTFAAHDGNMHTTKAERRPQHRRERKAHAMTVNIKTTTLQKAVEAAQESGCQYIRLDGLNTRYIEDFLAELDEENEGAEDSGDYAQINNFIFRISDIGSDQGELYEVS